MKLPDLKWDANGLIPTIVTHANTGQVLMFAWSNKESLEKMLSTGLTTLWSRSRKSLWQKGETSGNVQRVTDIQFDCDEDTLLVKVLPEGPTCHTGEYSCFFRSLKDQDGVNGLFHEALDAPTVQVIEELFQVIKERKRTRPEGSYTAYLFEKGEDKILKKIGEEAAETIVASKNGRPHELAMEMSDLIYHMLVLLAHHDLPLDLVLKELQLRRHAKEKEKKEVK